MSQDPYTDAVASLASALIADRSMDEILTEVATIVVDAIPPARMAGISMEDHGRPATRIHTDHDSVAIDQAQYDSGRGPCLDAWRRREVVVLHDLDGADEYPEFAARAKEFGIHSTLSLPLAAAGQGLGALNLYAPEARSFTAEHERLGVELASAAAVVMVNAAAYQAAVRLSEQLSEAIEDRTVIELAKGILMAGRPGTTADEASAMLAGAARRQGIELREVAQQIVDRAPDR